MCEFLLEAKVTVAFTINDGVHALAAALAAGGEVGVHQTTVSLL